jgi:protein kinase-like protein
MLPPGTRLGSYELSALIGTGGMGDVYRARDTRLDRTVAIKILKTEFSHRFDREARALSALNHPHICSLHDVGKDGDTEYLVMEYVQGKPLACPMEVRQAVEFGVQMADALATAHRQGAIHPIIAVPLLKKSCLPSLDHRGASAARGEICTRSPLPSVDITVTWLGRWVWFHTPASARSARRARNIITTVPHETPSRHTHRRVRAR